VSDSPNGARPFLTAEWRDLAMLNYEIDPACLRPLVPRGTELDSFAGRVFVSVVGFRFLRTRVFGMAVPRHRDFEEVNLRFYVRRRAGCVWRRGVVFVKEIVPRRAIAWLARRTYNENYVALRMRHEVMAPPGAASSPGRAAYEWRHGDRWHRLSLEFSGAAQLPDEVSEEAFITEHYWGYVRQRDGGTLEYQVEHPRWSVWRASGATLECDVAGLYGAEFARCLGGAPSSAFVAQGSPVVVRRGTRL
jgi:uncharacterized protein YqjF (DUF2071 family)